MNKFTRQEFNPFNAPFFVLVERLIAGGVDLKFGDKLPDHTEIMHVVTHYNNGATGLASELELLKGVPLEVVQDDPLRPVARFVAFPDEVAEEEEEIEEAGGDIFSLENAGLLKAKKDIAAYAKLFNIELEVSSTISMKAMLVTLEEKATKMGLIKE